MSIKRILFNLLLNMLIFNFVCSIITGVVLPIDIIYLVASLMLVAGAIVLYEPILKFLTVKDNFLTQWLMTTLLVFAAVYFLQSFMPQFRVEGFSLGSVSYQVVSVTGLTFNSIATMAIISVITGLFASIFRALKD